MFDSYRVKVKLEATRLPKSFPSIAAYPQLALRNTDRDIRLPSPRLCLSVSPCTSKFVSDVEMQSRNISQAYCWYSGRCYRPICLFHAISPDIAAPYLSCHTTYYAVFLSFAQHSQITAFRGRRRLDVSDAARIRCSGSPRTRNTR